MSLSPLQRIWRNASWMTLASFFYLGCQWLLLAALTKLLSPEATGRYGLALALVAPLVRGFALHLGPILVTDPRPEVPLGGYLSLRGATSLLVLGLCLVLALLSPAPLALTILLVCLFKLLESASDLLFHLLIRHEGMKTVAVARLLKGAGMALVWVVLLLWTGELAWALLGACLVFFVVLWFYERRQARLLASLRFSFSWDEVRRLLRDGLPLGLVAGLLALSMHLPAYFLQRYASPRHVGYFVALNAINIPLLTLVASWGSAFAPRLARAYNAGERSLFLGLAWRLLGGALLAGLLFLGLTWTWSRPLLTLLYRADYAAHATAFSWLVLAGALGGVYSALGFLLTATRGFRSFPLLYGAATAVEALAAWLLVPTFSLTGAAWSLALFYLSGALLKISLLVWRLSAP